MENKGKKSAAARNINSPTTVVPLLAIMQNIVLPAEQSVDLITDDYGCSNVQLQSSNYGYQEDGYTAENIENLNYIDNRDANAVGSCSNVQLQLAYGGHQQSGVGGLTEFPTLSLSNDDFYPQEDIAALIDALNTDMSCSTSEVASSRSETAIFNGEQVVEPPAPLSTNKTPSFSMPLLEDNDNIETPLREDSTLSLNFTKKRKASHSGVGDCNGGESKMARPDLEVEATPSTSKSRSRKSTPKQSGASILKQMLSSASSLPAFVEETGPKKKGKQVVKNSKVKAKNVRPTTAGSVVTKAGRSGATLSAQVEHPIPVVNLSSESGSESESDVFSQAEDREWFRQSLTRCRRLGKESEVLNTNIQSAREGVEREEEKIKKNKSEIKKMEEEIRRLQEECRRSENLIENHRSTLQRDQRALDKVTKMRAAIKKAFDC